MKNEKVKEIYIYFALNFLAIEFKENNSTGVLISMISGRRKSFSRKIGPTIICKDCNVEKLLY